MKLSVVMVCSQRKAEAPAKELYARNLPVADIETRSSAWRARLRKATGRRQLLDLYRGEGWSVLPSLHQAAAQAGFEPRFLVASAGLGLRNIESSAPAYAATFAAGQEDAVGDSPDDLQVWWRSLQQLPSALDMSDELRGPVLLVLSATYATVMHEDLVALGAHGDDIMLVGGATDVPGVHRLPAERTLRSALGGTATGLTARMALRWLRDLDEPRLTSESQMKRWAAWADGARRPEVWNRTPLDDTQVLDFIRDALRAEPSISRTRALRRLRNSGWACEQARFAALFSQAESTT